MWAGSKPDMVLLAKALREAGGKPLEKRLRDINKDSAQRMRDASRSNLRSLGGVHSRAATAVGAVSDRAAVKLRIRATATRPFALAATMGMRARSGWFAWPRFRDVTTQQHPPWVGSQWDPGDRKDMPYGVGPAVNEGLEDLLSEHAEAVEALIHEAFDEGA